jgi:mRNA-degrading endonuclease toxin of MazEF toxin-antitoxin module
MPRLQPGEVWPVDLGLTAKVRPCLILSDYPADDELARVRENQARTGTSSEASASFVR